MTKEVIIEIRGLQNGPQTDGEPIETVSAGEYFFKNGKHYVLFEEVPEDGGKPIKNRIKIAPGHMELTKSGSLSATMVFEDGKKNLTHYNTPFGSILMGIDTKKVFLFEMEDLLRVSVEYALEMNEEFVADCDIQISVKSR